MRRCMGCMQEFDDAFDVCPDCGYVYNSPAKSKSHLPPGTVLQNRYTIGKVLGQGGFGITYIAWDQRLEKPVAIKEFFPTSFAARLTGQNEVACFNAESQQFFDSGLQRMMNESRLLARFSEQINIVHVLDCIEENRTAYIIMELLRGETVQSILQREGQMTLERTMQIILPILQALETIHRTGLVHRDVSPDNLFVCEDGTVKLLDFGSARIASGLDHKTLSVMLKKGFAPIEQYSSHGKQGPYTDVYAVCATMYAMLTGTTPESSLDRMVQDTLRPISDYTTIPKAVENVIMKGMAVEASERTQSARELGFALQRAWKKTPAHPSFLSEEREPAGDPAGAGQTMSVRTFKRICIVLIVAIVALAVAVGVIFGIRFTQAKSRNAVFTGTSLTSTVDIADDTEYGT